MISMKRLGALAVAVPLIGAGIMAPGSAKAWWAYGWGGHVRVGVAFPPVVVAPAPVYVPPPVVYAPPPVVVYAPPRGPAWVPGHWSGGYWIAGHWA